MKSDAMPMPELSYDQAAHYRREGYLALPGVLPAAHVEACKAALSDLIQDRIPRCSTNLYYEAGQRIEGLAADERELRVRRLDSFCDEHPALAAANSRRLHAALDQLSGIGRTLFQEMALVKPPGIGAAKPWHQDASYFMLREPSHVIGTWIALDAATLDNGCMQFIPRSQLDAAVPHVQESLASCSIRPDRLSQRSVVPVPMQPGDAVVFHGLIQHFTDDKHSATRRRALQFHFCQAGAAWATSTIMPPCTATKRANTALASHRNMAKRRCASCVAKRKKPCCRWIGREAARQPMMH